jgi:hypothetical protein
MKKAALFSLLVLVLLIPVSIKAAPSKNPIFATIEQVQQMINNAVQNPKTLRVFDNNGQELGILVDREGTNTEVFIEQYNRFLILERTTVTGMSFSDSIGAEFESNNCTGQAYAFLDIDPPNGDDFNSVVNEILYTLGKFRIVNRNSTSSTITVKSFSETNTSCAQPAEPYEAEQRYPLEEIPPLYSSPIVLPLQFKYQ